MQPLLYNSAVFFLLVSASIRFCFFSLFILLFSVFFFFVVGEQKNSFFNTCIFRLWSSCHVERRSNLYEPLNTYTDQRCRWLQQARISDQKKIMNKIYNSHQPIFVCALPHFIFRMHCIMQIPQPFALLVPLILDQRYEAHLFLFFLFKIIFKLKILICYDQNTGNSTN